MVKSKKAVVAVVSALTGLLPIKGRVTVSAGMLDTLAPDKGCCGREKFGPIDYVSTHHYYFWSPLEKTVILPMAAFGLTYGAWIGIIWPLLAVTIAFILAYLIWGVKESDVILKDCQTPIKVSRITRYVFPYIAGVGAIIAGLSGNSSNVFTTSSIFGFLAIALAAINIFGGFLVTQRMLAMYKKKKKDKQK